MNTYTEEQKEKYAYVRDALRAQETKLAYGIARAFRELQDTKCYSVKELDAIAIVIYRGLRNL